MDMIKFFDIPPTILLLFTGLAQARATGPATGLAQARATGPATGLAQARATGPATGLAQVRAAAHAMGARPAWPGSPCCARQGLAQPRRRWAQDCPGPSPNKKKIYIYIFLFSLFRDREKRKLRRCQEDKMKKIIVIIFICFYGL